MRTLWVTFHSYFMGKILVMESLMGYFWGPLYGFTLKVAYGVNWWGWLIGSLYWVFSGDNLLVNFVGCFLGQLCVAFWGNVCIYSFGSPVEVNIWTNYLSRSWAIFMSLFGVPFWVHFLKLFQWLFKDLFEYHNYWNVSSCICLTIGQFKTV